MSVQNSAQTAHESRGVVSYMASIVRPGPALGYDLVRAYLGIGLFVRGILFVSQPELVLGYLQDLHSWFLPYALVHFVAVAHLCGGVMLAARAGSSTGTISLNIAPSSHFRFVTCAGPRLTS